MKLRNKKTGEIDDVSIIHSANKIKGVVEHEDGVQCLFAYTLKEFNEEWEDYEESKEYWYIDWTPEIGVYSTRETFSIYDNKLKEIGNYFETKEEAEKAVEKLKAWKRLKDKGFRFNAWFGSSKNIEWGITGLENESYIPRQICDDLDLLFGGVE